MSPTLAFPSSTNSPLSLTLLGLAIIVSTVGVLSKGKPHPIVAMTIIPFVGALIAGHDLSEISGFYGHGLDRVISVVVMFIFAIIFFGILSDVRLFEPVITTLISSTRGKVMLVTMGTAAIAVVAHLDGSGSTTFLLTIPALLPLYQAMKTSRYTHVTIVALSASVMNMVTWAGPVGRAATVIESTPNEIWRHILRAQGVALLLVFVVAAVFGVLEKRRIARSNVSTNPNRSMGNVGKLPLRSPSVRRNSVLPSTSLRGPRAGRCGLIQFSRLGL